MPLTDNTSSEAQSENGNLEWVYAASAVLGLAVTMITLYVYFKKGTI